MKPWAIGVIALVVVLGAAEWSSTVGVPCTFDRDLASMLTGTCGTQFNVTCPGARPNGTIAHGHTPEAFADGLLLHAYVSENDVVTVEACCIAGLTCNPTDAGYSLRIFNP